MKTQCVCVSVCVKKGKSHQSTETFDVQLFPLSNLKVRTTSCQMSWLDGWMSWLWFRPHKMMQEAAQS